MILNKCVRCAELKRTKTERGIKWTCGQYPGVYRLGMLDVEPIVEDCRAFKRKAKDKEKWQH